MSKLPDRFKGREERQRLAELETVVEGRLRFVKEAADALREISESKLYRLDYKTFDEYCKKRWKFGRDSGYKLIASSKSSATPTSTDSAGSLFGTPPLCSFCANTDPVEDCKHCKKLQVAWLIKESIKARFGIDDSAFPVFEHTIEYEKLSKAVLVVSKRLRKLEGSFPFQKTVGQKHRYLAEKMVNVSKTVAQLMPSRMCEACNGAVDASPDSDPCETCKGKGFLTVADIEVLDKEAAHAGSES